MADRATVDQGARDPEELVAYLMVHFGPVLDAAMDNRRGRHQKMPLVGGLVVPATTALAVVSVAGGAAAGTVLPVEVVFAQSAKGGPLARRVQRLSEAISQDLAGGTLDDVWLAPLAAGLGARGAHRDVVLGFVGVPGRGRLRRDRLAAYVDRFERESRRTARSVVSDQVRRLQEMSATGLSVLPRPPYPDHLTVNDLAEALDVAFLDDTGPDLFVGASLSSDLYTGADRQPAVETVKALRRAVVLGDPGCGKTTILQATCLQRIRDRIGVTVFARLDALAELAVVRPPTTSKDAAELVVSAWDGWRRGRCTDAERRSMVAHLLDDPSAFVALDALDEISSSERHDACLRLLDLLGAIPGAIVVTSRITGFVRPVPLDDLVVVPALRQGAPEAFIRRWFDGPGADPLARDRALGAVQSDQGLGDIAHNPLIAGFVCAVAAFEDVKQTKHGLYGQYVERFLVGAWRTPDAPARRRGADVLEILDVATAVAWTMATMPGEVHDRWLDSVRLSTLADDPRIGRDALTLYETIGLLVPHRAADPARPLSQEVRWLHRTIHEHLVGRALFRLAVSDPEQARTRFREAVLRPAWQVPLEHALGFVQESGDLTAVVDDLLSTYEDAAPLTVPDAQLARALGALTSQHGRDELADRLVARGAFYDVIGLGRAERLLDLDFASLPSDHAIWAIVHVVEDLPDDQAKLPIVRRLAMRPEWTGWAARQIDDVESVIDPEAAMNRLRGSSGYLPGRRLLHTLMRSRPDEARRFLVDRVEAGQSSLLALSATLADESEAARALVMTWLGALGTAGELMTENIVSIEQERDFDIFRCSHEAREDAVRGTWGTEISTLVGRILGAAEARLPDGSIPAAELGYWIGVSRRDDVRAVPRTSLDDFERAVRSVEEDHGSIPVLIDLNRALVATRRHRDARCIPALHRLTMVLARPWHDDLEMVADWVAVDSLLGQLSWRDRWEHWSVMVVEHASDALGALGAGILEDAARHDPDEFFSLLERAMLALSRSGGSPTAMRDLLARPTIALDQFDQWFWTVRRATERCSPRVRDAAAVVVEEVAHTHDLLLGMQEELLDWCGRD